MITDIRRVGWQTFLRQGSFIPGTSGAMVTIDGQLGGMVTQREPGTADAVGYALVWDKAFRELGDRVMSAWGV